MKFVWSLIWIAMGFLVIRYTYQIVQYFGKVGWAERYLSGGFGGTYFMYKSIGVIIIAFAMLYMFGALEIFTSSLSPFFGGE